jgi:periplasmic protein TonB
MRWRAAGEELQVNVHIDESGGQKFRALQFSLAVHLLFLLVVILWGGTMEPPKKFLVVDLTTEYTEGRASSTSGTAPLGNAVGKDRTKVGKREKRPAVHASSQSLTSYPFPDTPAAPVTEDVQALPQNSGKLLNSMSSAAIPRSYGTSSIIAVPSDSSFGSGTTAAGNGAPSSEGPGGSGMKKSEYLRKNFSYIRDLIQKNVIYPPLARRMGWEGKVTVSFVIFSDGRVSDIKVKESSGRAILDNSAIETVRKASPFPVPPTEAQIMVPILYKLI